MSNLVFAFGLTLFAGLATGIGSALAFFAKRSNQRFLAIALGFSAGVMLYVSFTEILAKADVALTESYGARGHALAVASFFGGILVIGLIDRLIPAYENPHEPRRSAELEPLKHAATPEHPQLLRMGVLAALAIGIHNFPEGLATFLAAMDDPKLGVAIAIAISLHNIPEGVSVSVPIYYATGSRRRAFMLSFLSGLAEPVGAVVGYFLLSAFLPKAAMGVLFGGVAGIMVFISVDELLPTARAYGKTHDAIYGTIAGMAVMAASLVMMK